MNTASTKPYLVRAIWEWCVDQGFTPYVAVTVDEHTRVPPGFARDGQIVLNLSPDATGQLQMGNDLITFQARFGGVAHSLGVPMSNVLAIYARENGQGMAFNPESDLFGDEDVAAEAGEAVSEGAADHRNESDPTGADESTHGAPAPEEDGTGGEGGPVPPRPARGSHLKVVK